MNQAMPFPQELVSIKASKLFLNLYSRLQPGEFAVIKISGETLEKNFGQTIDRLVFLNKAGMTPIVVHGAGAILDKKLVSSKKIDGVRVTGEKDLEVIKNVFKELNSSIVGAINEKGGKAKTVQNVFKCIPLPGFGFSGKIISLNLGAVKACLRRGEIPVISPVGRNGEFFFNINADTAAKELVKAFNPKKFFLVTETGGVLDGNGKVISFINVDSETALEGVSGGMLQKLKEIKDFLENCPGCDVVITSADSLLREIFSLHGCGTLIKSYQLKSAQGFRGINKGKLKKLIEDAFGKPLLPDYFSEEPSEILYEKNYEGAAIIKAINGIAYLDKLAVAKHRQGAGLGKSLWALLSKKYPALVWRASLGSDANFFYSEKCDGMVKIGGWNVYWTNLREKDVFPTAKEAAKICVSFEGAAGCSAKI